MMISFQEAEREKLYAKIAMIGASGSGKTVSALKLAYGLTGDWGSIYVADTENKRALAYVGTSHTGLDIGKFKHAPMYAPFKTEYFEEAIDTVVKLGGKCLIIDSFSHEWEGLGGVTHAAEEAGGEFWHWKGPKIAHRRLVDKIQQSPIHIIVTIRTKQEYAVIPGGGKNGKNAIEKLGMKPVQSNDLDYEFLIAFHVNEDNEVVAKKDNTGLFKGEEFRIEALHGEKLKEWLIEGKEVKTVSQERQESEARQKFIVSEFKKRMEADPKIKTYFTNLEIKNNRSLDQFPLATLETLYAKMTAPKEEPKQEKKEEGNMILDSVYELRDSNPECKALYDEYTSKMKVNDASELKPKALQTLYNMLEAKHKQVVA
jgi:hypothetical protein